ncbi:MAG: hypothetical protein KGP14_08650 [Betaproteobacteria bacterium]|nr:hypothetical protein [Betaproteobacteria bacterium]
MRTQHPITERELRAAYKRSGLWRLGVTYERAIDVPAIRTALNCSVKAARRRAEQAGHPMPAQLGLI